MGGGEGARLGGGENREEVQEIRAVGEGVPEDGTGIFYNSFCNSAGMVVSPCGFSLPEHQ